jgi:predicted PurR-regulated permease PerM
MAAFAVGAAILLSTIKPGGMPDNTIFNHRVKHIILLLVLSFFIFIVLKELYILLPGILGAVTLYILSRGSYFQLVYHRKWPKGWTAGLYLIGYLSLLALLGYLIFSIVENKTRPFLSDPAAMMTKTKLAISEAQQRAGFVILSDEALGDFQKKITDFVPRLINDTGILLSNLAIMLFMLYYMLVHGKEMETFMGKMMPFKKSNTGMLAAETKRLVKASALGIPIISIIQGITATIGYAIFGVKEYVIWGFLTGVFAFFPVVGTLIVWIPLVTYMYISGDTGNATALFFYSLIITGNIDYLSRITLLKKFGHIHPVVTVLGVIAGLGLFGFIGFIFGPLLINYIILLFRIFLQDFTEEAHPPAS